MDPSLAPCHAALVEHPVYQTLDSVAGVRAFMRVHAFAVWDFMSLLKTMQRRLTCVDVPWTPAVNREGTRLVNEIVLAEESEALADGTHASHFEVYLVVGGASLPRWNTYLGIVSSACGCGQSGLILN